VQPWALQPTLPRLVEAAKEVEANEDNAARKTNSERTVAIFNRSLFPIFIIAKIVSGHLHIAY
jgi:hypothetical protein